MGTVLLYPFPMSRIYVVALVNVNVKKARVTGVGVFNVMHVPDGVCARWRSS